MQRIDRLPLPEEAVARLNANTEAVARSADPAKTAADLWRALARDTRRSVQQALAKMCSGLQRCMYCEDGQGTDIEHFRPKATFPLAAFSWNNYLLACSHCNSNHKRTQFPVRDDGAPLLIDPTVDDPLEHLTLSPSTGLFEAVDAKGQAAVQVCALNRPICAAGRQDAWTTLNVLLGVYAATARQDPESVEARNILRAIRRHPFQSVRAHLVRFAETAARPDLLLPAATLRALRDHPELALDS